MRRVGLTGAIASGKSVVAERLRELGAAVIDHDDLARAALAPGSVGESAVFATFPQVGRHADGSLDRASLASIVFASVTARRKLEAIVHPTVRRRAHELEAKATASVVVHDIPLLVETGQARTFDDVVVVHAPLGVRVERLAARGLDEAHAMARIRAQASDAQRKAVATVVLDGGGSVANLRGQVDEMWRNWQ